MVKKSFFKAFCHFYSCKIYGVFTDTVSLGNKKLVILIYMLKMSCTCVLVYELEGF